MTRVEEVGRVGEVWRYPVKSMHGERLPHAPVGPGGIAGDRQFALVDRETGKVVSAKNPKKWPNLLHFRARFIGAGRESSDLRITLPDGTPVPADHPDADAVLSAALGRPVTLCSAPGGEARIEVSWPAVAGLATAGSETEEVLPPGSFFDLAPLHLLTTATLRRLAAGRGGGRFDPARFRPNVVIETAPTLEGFVEDGWLGRTLSVGDSVRLRVTACCSRCVMTTLEQPGLGPDPGVLRAAAADNGTHVGVYAEVVCGGVVREGDSVAVCG